MNVQPFKSPTLPPATTTNAVIVGTTARWLIDPAATSVSEKQSLLNWAEAARATAGLAGIALTHHHRDHVGAASWLAAAMGLPVAAHATTAALAKDSRLAVTRTLADGDVLSDGWVALHTPGHASDHLCFVHQESGRAAVGDMVAATGTIVIDPPDGHMGTYLAQLARLRALGLRQIVPAHGPPIDDPWGHFSTYIEHRMAREARVLAALADAPQSLAAITATSYPELDRRLLPLAERACLAHLEHLMEADRAHWEPVATPDPGPRPWTALGGMWRN